MSTKPFHFKNDRDGRWERCVQDFLESKDRASSGHATLASYKCTLKLFFENVDKRPDQIIRQDIETFLHRPGRAGQPSFNTINSRLSVLKSFYTFASEQQTPGGKSILKSNPTTGIKPAKGSQIDRDIEEQHVLTFFAQISRDTLTGLRDRALFLCYLYTARRRAEIANLLWGDFEQVATASGPAWFYIFKQKRHFAKDSQREMPPRAMTAIEEYLRANDRWGRMKPEEPIFINHHHTHAAIRPIHPTTVDGRFRLYAARAQIPEAAVVHSFRHLSAWLRYQANGHDILAVAEDLGHTGTATILRYIKRREAKYKLDEIARKLEAQFANL